MGTGASASLVAPVGLLGDGTHTGAENIVEVVAAAGYGRAAAGSERLGAGLGRGGVIRLDAKYPRGSKRGELAAVQVLVAAAQQMGGRLPLFI